METTQAGEGAMGLSGVMVWEMGVVAAPTAKEDRRWMREI
jgi:hypothetical protein